jgi:hypothetical protein
MSLRIKPLRLNGSQNSFSDDGSRRAEPVVRFAVPWLSLVQGTLHCLQLLFVEKVSQSTLDKKRFIPFWFCIVNPSLQPIYAAPLPPNLLLV